MTSADLIAELRAARPTAGGALHDRVRELAAVEPSRRASPFASLSLRRCALVAAPATAGVAIAVAGVAGVLGSNTSDSPSIVAESAGATAPDASSARQGLAPVLKAGAAADAATPAPTTGRAQRYSAQLTIAVEDVGALSSATQSALQATRDLGGYLVSVSYATADTGTSSLTLRVPTTKVQDAIVRLSGLGRIVAQQVQIDDLQGQVDELTKREANLRARIAVLSERLAADDLDATTRATLVARRDAARSELAQVRAGHAQVSGEARYATIQLSLQTERQAAVPAVPSRLDRSLDRAGEILVVEATAVLYALVVLGPLALVLLLGWLVARVLRRQADERLLSAP